MSDLKMTNAKEYMGGESGTIQISSEDFSEDLNYARIAIPKYSGCWIIGGSLYVRVLEEKTPTPEQIKNTEEMFGWEWQDYL